MKTNKNYILKNNNMRYNNSIAKPPTTTLNRRNTIMNKNEIENKLMDIRKTVCKENVPCWQCKYAVWDSNYGNVCSFDYIIDKMNEEEN